MNIPERISALRALMAEKAMMPTWFLPTIITRVNMSGNISRQEHLSPVLPVLPVLLSSQRMKPDFGPTDVTLSRRNSSLAEAV